MTTKRLKVKNPFTKPSMVSDSTTPIQQFNPYKGELDLQLEQILNPPVSAKQTGQSQFAPAIDKNAILLNYANKARDKAIKEGEVSYTNPITNQRTNVNIEPEIPDKLPAGIQFLSELLGGGAGMFKTSEAYSRQEYLEQESEKGRRQQFSQSPNDMIRFANTPVIGDLTPADITGIALIGAGAIEGARTIYNSYIRFSQLPQYKAMQQFAKTRGISKESTEYQNMYNTLKSAYNLYQRGATDAANRIMSEFQQSYLKAIGNQVPFTGQGGVPATNSFLTGAKVPMGTQSGAMEFGGQNFQQKIVPIVDKITNGIKLTTQEVSLYSQNLANKIVNKEQWNIVDRQFYANNAAEVESTLKEMTPKTEQPLSPNEQPKANITPEVKETYNIDDVIKAKSKEVESAKNPLDKSFLNQELTDLKKSKKMGITTVPKEYFLNKRTGEYIIPSDLQQPAVEPTASAVTPTTPEARVPSVQGVPEPSTTATPAITSEPLPQVPQSTAENVVKTTTSQVNQKVIKGETEKEYIERNLFGIGEQRRTNRELLKIEYRERTRGTRWNPVTKQVESSPKYQPELSTPETTPTMTPLTSVQTGQTMPEPLPEVTESTTKPVTGQESTISQEEAVVPPSEQPVTPTEQPESKKPFRGVVLSDADKLLSRISGKKIKGKVGKVLNIKGIKQIAKLVSPVAVSDDVGSTLSAAGGILDDEITGAMNIAMSRVKRLSPNIKKLFELDDKGIVQASDITQIQDLPNGNRSMALHDIVEYESRYDFGDKSEKRIELIQAIRETAQEASNMLRNEGILVDKKTEPWQIQAKKGESDWVFLHRVVTEIKEEAAEGVSTFLSQTIKSEGIDFKRHKGETDYQYVARFAESVSDGTVKTTPKIDNLLETFANLADVEVKKTTLDAKRKWETVAEGLKGGTTYDPDIINEVRKQVSMSYSLVKKNRVSEIIKRLLVTTTPTEQAQLDLNIDAEKLSTDRTNSSNLVAYLQRAARGEALPGGVITALRKNFPEIASRLDEIYSVLPRDRSSLIKRVIGDTIKYSRITQGEGLSVARRAEISSNIRLAFSKFGTEAKINLSDISEALNQTIRDKATASRVIRELYLSMSAQQKQDIKNLVDEAKTIKGKYDSQWKEYQDLVQKYSERMGSLGTAEYGSVIGVPGLSGRYIVSQNYKTGQELADDIRRKFGYMPQSGSDVAIKAVGQVGAVMRMLRLGYDMSMEFIQMALTLGFDIRNAIMLKPTAAWGKATIGATKTLFSKNMQHLDSFLDSNREIVVDFVSRGGLVETGEAVEGVEPIQTLIAKIKEGKVKSVGEFLSKHFLGRSEAVFTTGRVMAAVNLYKAGYQQAQKTNQLNEWAQLVNKMTGVLSTKAMGISAAQRSIEGTFAFMSPRFTRASGAILGDIIAHPSGYTAKQAGTSLVALLGAWVALAFAVNGVQDKETNLNPADPDFMKVYIGNRYVRLGGIINDIRRLAAVVDSIAYYTSGKNISLSDKEDNTQPLDELLFNQFKGKTSPITGTAIDVTRKLTDETATDFEGNPLTWTGILGDWITPAWTDPIINSELESASGAIAEILGLTSAIVKYYKKDIDSIFEVPKDKNSKKTSPFDNSSKTPFNRRVKNPFK